MVIGRRSKCDFVIKDELVSGFHCKIHEGETAFYIEDLKASNPAQINGEGLNSGEKKKIKHHDKLTIGSLNFIIVDASKENETSYQSMLLEKVKIHETFDSDKDFSQNKKFWVNEDNQQNKVLELEQKVNKIKKSKETVESLKEEYQKIKETIDESEQTYSRDELNSKLDKVEKDIESLKFKKEKIKELIEETAIRESKLKRLQSLKEKIKEKEKTYNENEFNELTRSLQLAKENLDRLKKAS
jgi:predicted component of type VI protein secretion system